MDGFELFIVGIAVGLGSALILSESGVGGWKRGPFHVEKCYPVSLVDGVLVSGKAKFKVYEGSKPGKLCYKVAQ